MKRTRDIYMTDSMPFKKRPRYRKAKNLRNVGELKGLDTEIDVAGGSVLATTSTNGSVHVLNLVDTGTGSWNRVGRKIAMQSLRLKGVATYSYDVGTTTNAGILRMVVVFDKSPNSGSIPTFDTIFGRTNQSGTESCEFLDNLRYDNTGRFSVLSDTVINAKPEVDPSVINAVNTPFDIYINMRGRETIYSGQSSVSIANIASGAVYVYFRANVNSGATPFSRFTIDHSHSRLRYYDA